HFQGQLAEVQLDQVIHRAVDDFLQSPVSSLSFSGTPFATEDGFQSGHVQQSARAVNEPLIDRVQLPAAFEQKIAAVFQLVAEISVVKARTFLLLVIERKAQTGRIDPAIHHLRQARQAPGAVQLLSQPIKASQVGAAHKTVALLNPGDGLFLSLTLYPFMPIERNLQAKGRMAAHFNGEVSPLRVDNMKMVMVDEP